MVPYALTTYTCPCQFSRPADLGASHVIFEIVSKFPGRFIPVCTSDVVPHVREHGILEDTLTILVPKPEVVLRTGLALFGGQPVPAHRFGEVLEDTLTIGAHVPEIELRNGVTLLGGHSVPLHGFGIVLEDTLTLGVHEPEVELCCGDTLLGSQPIPAHGFGIVLEDTLPLVVHEPEAELCGGITLLGSLTDRVEIVLCREHHDGEATHHDHGSSYADQPWYFIYRLQM